MSEQAKALKEKTEQHANVSAAPSGEASKTQAFAAERPGKPSIEPRSARGASTTSARKTAREADDSLQEKIAKAHAGDIPVFTEPTPQSPAPFTQAKGEASGLAPVSTVRAMPELTKKEKNGKAAQAKSNAKAGSKAEPKAAAKPVAKPDAKARAAAEPQPAPKKKAPQASAKAAAPKLTSASPKAADSAQTHDTRKTAQKQPEARPEQKAESAQQKTAQKTQKPAEKPQGASPRMPARDATGRFLPSGKKKAKGKAAHAAKPEEAKAGEEKSAEGAPLLSMLMNEAPSGVAAELAPDERPARGEVKGSPAKDNAETIEIPNGREAVHDSERGSASPAHEAEADEKEEDYDAVPDPAVMLTELADEEEEEEEDDGTADDEAVPEETEDASPRVEPGVPTVEPGFHATETLSGRRTPVRPKAVAPANDPSRSVDLEAERIDAEHAARQALLRLKARSQPARSELASKLAGRSIAEMERGNPAFAQDPKDMEPDNTRGKTETPDNPKAAAIVPGISPDARTQGWNAMWGNGVKAAEAEQAAMVDVRRPPQYAFEDDEAGALARDASYAERMDAWEKAVLAEGESRDQRVSCRGPKPGPRVPVRTKTHETLGGFPTPHATRTWTGPGFEDSEKVSTFERLRMKLNTLHARWSGLEACLRGAIGIACVTAVAAAASWTAARTFVPELALRHAPFAVTAVVSDDEIRNLMLLTAMLDARGKPTGRTAPLVDRVYLTGDLRKALASDDEASRMALPLDDALLRAAVMEASDMAGAPVLSRKAVLAMPAAAHSSTGRTIDVTELVVERLGLKNVSAAAAKEALAGLMSPAGANVQASAHQPAPEPAPQPESQPKTAAKAPVRASAR